MCTGFWLQGQYYELPAQAADCPASFKDRYSKGKWSKKCGRLGKEVEQNFMLGGEGGWELTWSPFSSALSRGQFGRSVCKIAEDELGEADVGGDGFPDPLRLGYYYNYCGKKSWYDTGVRSDGEICCRVGIQNIAAFYHYTFCAGRKPFGSFLDFPTHIALG